MALAVPVVSGILGGFAANGRLRRAFAMLAEIATLLVILWLGYRIGDSWAWQGRLVLSYLVVLIAALANTVLFWSDLAITMHRIPVLKARILALGHPADSSRATLIGAGIAAVSAIVAASLAVPQFWYSAHYQPSTTVPLINVTNSIENIRERGKKLEITASVTLRNSGKTSVRVLASMYEITGTKVTEANPGRGLDEGRWKKALKQNYGPAARYNSYAGFEKPVLIQFGPVAMDTAWLEPQETTRATVVAFAPKGAFDLLRVTTDVAAGRADRLPIEDDRRTFIEHDARTPFGASGEKGCGGAKGLETRWDMRRTSWLEILTTSEQEVMTVWGVTEGEDSPWWPSDPWIDVQLQRRGKPCEHIFDDDHGLEDQAMVGWSGAVADAAPPGK
ncbi:hypothetical protein ABZ725_51250 [Streptomyces sp. NPDC006872]|uniref:hypothetical protein n=1 Tax=Streptomyces sp. NPDC006872 TaxID=3155720 RepID=UPI0033E20A04